MVLDDREREKLDDRDDAAFYAEPRLVTHVDDGFRDQLTAVYDEHLSAGARVFDAMSSHVSHLPDRSFERVVGHGMNERELAANDRLTDRFVQNFNETQRLPLADDAFDAVLCAVSVQYLEYPERTFDEFGRVLAPDGTLVVSFSNRMFPTKAVRAWRSASMDGRAALVGEYIDATDRFTDPQVSRCRPERDPFCAVIARGR
ncbi:MAG: methylase involved in ubiquinone/menaquinone biosynthesis [uncultured archaeon A07HR67]|nr:MAG: methylase involved in ubiquinone/menaquinone biosynthesis [uncultured archaeon A07HR67]